MRAASTAALTVLLAACSGGFHSSAPASQVYVLRAAAARPQGQLMGPASSLRIGRPIAGPGLDTDHVLLVQPDHRMSYYTASRWPAELPDVVEALVVDTLRASGEWTTVQDSRSAFSSEYLLQMSIRRFEAEYSSGNTVPEVHVVFDCTVGRRSGREVVASFVAEGSARAAANRLSDVISAFEEAANQALAETAAHAYQGVHSSQNVDSPVPSITR